MSGKRRKRERVTDLVTIHRRGKVWHAQFMRGGKQQGRSLGTSFIEEAKAKALDLDFDLRKGLCIVSEDIEVDALFNRYTRYLGTEGRSPSTIKRYRPVFRRFAEFCKERGIRKASHVDLGLVEDFRGMRLEDGAADGTRYRETLWIKQVWKYAEDRRLLAANRIKAVSPKKPYAEEQPSYTECQVEQIIASAEERDRDVFAVLAFTGMRRGDLQWLAWDDVDLDNGWLHIRAKDGWTPKNRKDRKLPIHPRAREVFEGLPRTHRWVFAAGPSKRFPNGGNQIHLDHLRERLLEILPKLGIERGGLHSFRRFFISHCANNGVPPTILMKWVGHSDLRMIMRYYRLQDDESQEAMEALDGGMNGPGFKTVLRQTAGQEEEPRSQTPVFRVVTNAAS